MFGKDEQIALQVVSWCIKHLFCCDIHNQPSNDGSSFTFSWESLLCNYPYQNEYVFSIFCYDICWHECWGHKIVKIIVKRKKFLIYIISKDFLWQTTHNLCKGNTREHDASQTIFLSKGGHICRKDRLCLVVIYRESKVS